MNGERVMTFSQHQQEHNIQEESESVSGKSNKISGYSNQFNNNSNEAENLVLPPYMKSKTLKKKVDHESRMSHVSADNQIGVKISQIKEFAVNKEE